MASLYELPVCLFGLRELTRLISSSASIRKSQHAHGAGPLADMYGGKLLLLISFLASAMSYALTASAGSVTMLFISKWVKGLPDMARG